MIAFGCRRLAAIAIVLGAGFAVPTTAGVAQEVTAEAPAVTTLREASERAALLLPDLAAGQASRDQFAAQRRAARGPFVGPPVVSGNIEIGRDGIGEQEAGISAGLRWPGEGRAAQLSADLGRDVVDATQGAARLALAGQVRAAWWALASARAAVAVERAQAGVADQELVAVTRLVDAGVQARRDLLLAQGERAAVRARLSAAETDAVGARAAYEALAGRPPEAFPAEVPAVSGIGIDEHPEMRAASARAAAAEANAAALRFGSRPRVNGSVGVRRERGGVRDEYASALLVGIGVPIGRDYTAAAATAGARSQAIRATAEAVLVRRRLVAERSAGEQRLAMTRRAAQEARQRRDVLSEALALTERGRREGELGFIEALRARQALFAASRDLAVADVAASAAISTFNQAQGVLP
ncbi:MAG: transporter [Sphingomonas bacterium]|uniref:TolC family protein n=1 Tax=Sphingomonas bacterium TaxID=1895847 RepID=UPI002608977E|nr:TolC family protein [Sphingomonas bacterium]MDB5696209.1 transporter [Sphingomonas bacterium]